MIVKICGIKDKETLLCCENNNVNYFGMIFYSKSPRSISIEKAKELMSISKNLIINGVGVFVNESINSINNFIKELNLEYVQLHGDEDEEYIESIKKHKIKVIKKISIGSQNDLIEMKRYNRADFFLFDYKPKKNELPGGNAKKFDWEILKNIKIEKPWFLSGGIDCDNIGLIKTKVKPFGVDLSSGVEKKLGIKDKRIIDNFIEIKNNA